MTRFFSRFATVLLLANAMLAGSQVAHAAPDEVTFLLPAPATLGQRTADRCTAAPEPQTGSL